MFPTIFDLGPIEIRSFGLLLAVSVVLGITLGARRAASAGLNPEVILGMAWLMVIAGVVGGRAMFVLQHLDEFRADPWEIFRVWRGGLTLYGCLILGGVATIWYLKRRTDRPWAFTDALAPFVSLGQGITRIGCFLNGCCFGRSCELPWAVTFPEDSLASMHLGYPHRVHPSQIYQSILGIGAFVFLSWLWGRRKFDGQVFWAFVIVEGAARFVADSARYYEPAQRIQMGPLMLSESQLVSIVLVVAGLIGYGIRRRRALESAS